MGRYSVVMIINGVFKEKGISKFRFRICVKVKFVKRLVLQRKKIRKIGFKKSPKYFIRCPSDHCGEFHYSAGEFEILKRNNT